MTEREITRRWVEAWRTAAPELDKIRLREVRDADNQADLAALAGAFEYALRTAPLEPTSGLVEMQRIFAKLRRTAKLR